MLTVTVFHNIATDEQGRLLGMLDGYSPGHALVPVATWLVPNLKNVLGDTWRLLNVGDDPEFGTPDPRAVLYRRASPTASCRSPCSRRWSTGKPPTPPHPSCSATTHEEETPCPTSRRSR